MGNDGGQGGLAHTGRPPQDETAQFAAVYHAAKHGSLTYEVLLTYIIIERRRTHAFCQWCHDGLYLGLWCNINNENDGLSGG